MARYFLTCWCVLTCSLQVFGQTPSYFLIGQTFHLKPIMSEQPDKILWKHNGKKLVEFNGKEEHVYGQHQHRATLDWITAELNITHVRYEDTGVYELDASNSNMVYQFFYRLQVIGKVSKPTITCTVRKGDSDESGPEATLTCSAESTRSESLVKYEWQSGGNVVPGQKLTIPLGDEHDNQIHTCRVNNPLSNEVETFTARSCYSDGGLSVGLVVGIVVVVLIILSVVLGILFCKRARKGCFAKTSKGDVEKQTPRGKEQDKKKKIFHEENLKLLTVGDSGGKKPKWPPSPLGQFYSPDLPNVTSGEKSHTEEGHVKRRVSEIEKQSTGKKPKWSPSPMGQFYSPDLPNVTSGEKHHAEDPVRALDFSEDTETSSPKQTDPEEHENENSLTKAPPVESISPSAERTSTQNSSNKESEEDTSTDQKSGRENVKESGGLEEIPDPESSTNEALPTDTECRSPPMASGNKDAEVKKGHVKQCASEIEKQSTEPEEHENENSVTNSSNKESEEDTSTDQKSGRENVKEPGGLEEIPDPESSTNEELPTVAALNSSRTAPQEEHSDESLTDQHTGDDSHPEMYRAAPHDNDESDVSRGCSPVDMDSNTCVQLNQSATPKQTDESPTNATHKDQEPGRDKEPLQDTEKSEEESDRSTAQTAVEGDGRSEEMTSNQCNSKEEKTESINKSQDEEEDEESTETREEETVNEQMQDVTTKQNV